MNSQLQRVSSARIASSIGDEALDLAPQLRHVNPANPFATFRPIEDIPPPPPPLQPPQEPLQQSQQPIPIPRQHSTPPQPQLHHPQQPPRPQRPIQPPQQPRPHAQQAIPLLPQLITPPQHHVQDPQQPRPSRRPIQPPLHAFEDVARFGNAPEQPPVVDLANNAPAPPNADLALLLPAPLYQSFPQHDYAALVADAPDMTSFVDVVPGQLQGLKLIPDPPDLDLWRNILFYVDEMITLSEEQYVMFLPRSKQLTTDKYVTPRFQIYFPHIDNVYSHRSTQRYKRNTFASHYWDCRLKGRPSGTPKSDDPNKKKRKRRARAKDLCDVKIKITEYFPSSGVLDDVPIPGEMLPEMHSMFPLQGSNAFSVLSSPGPRLPEDHPGSSGRRYFTIQRVNGTGTHGHGPGCGHKHSLEESDQVKKNSVQRILVKEDKERRKKSSTSTSTSRLHFFVLTLSLYQRNMPKQKSYHTKATGQAAVTAFKHSAESTLKLYGSCFCPFVQRVWIALEMKKIPYQYIEVDPYKKPQSLLDVNPRGLVPALRHGDWGCYESTVLLEYLEDLKIGNALLPEDAKLRAHCRLWVDHINRHIVPSFYRVLQEQTQEKQVASAKELRDALDKLIAAADPTGPFFMGSQLSFVDVQAAPWVIRLRRVLTPYRGWPDAEEGTRWASWVDAIEANEHVRATTSTDELYMDSYERYAGKFHMDDFGR
ncbi:uncharacterized protein N7482_003831 [Penicillium canariense]|uniref:Glutathione transferase n=1 Tax=Penicillium canariense TaxID=189055 RepID=A0A9W9LP09_9EURO|nr:uncharacterized protein N7482_003831 [Penicillium canariense]KAJ5168237.1 hypothetical protein N7482_003831 [Penicillium canariense]